MQVTRSATVLSPVLVEPNGSGGADVWLRRNIVQTDEDGQEMWDAEEVHGIVSGVPEESEIADDFETWWSRFEEAELTTVEILERVQAQVLYTALMTDTEVEYV